MLPEVSEASPSQYILRLPVDSDVSLWALGGLKKIFDDLCKQAAILCPSRGTWRGPAVDLAVLSSGLRYQFIAQSKKQRFGIVCTFVLLNQWALRRTHLVRWPWNRQRDMCGVSDCAGARRCLVFYGGSRRERKALGKYLWLGDDEVFPECLRSACALAANPRLFNQPAWGVRNHPLLSSESSRGKEILFHLKSSRVLTNFSGVLLTASALFDLSPSAGKNAMKKVLVLNISPWAPFRKFSDTGVYLGVVHAQEWENRGMGLYS